jgi:EmrB/QacA subfamily drug resistance transporter
LVVAINTFLVNVALPTLVRELHASTSELQLIVDAYLLVNAALVVVAGSLGDRFGRVRVLRAGLMIFGVSSAVAAWAQTPVTLIALRALMGVGAALTVPVGLSIVANLFTVPRERSRAFGAWAAIGGLGLALGPVVGGVLLSTFWWGSVFLVNVPVVLVVVLVIRRLVPESSNPHPPRFDPLGVLLAVTATSGLVWATVHAPSQGWAAPITLASYAIGLVLLGAFIAWELHCDHPMLELSFFRNPRYTAANFSTVTANFAWAGTLFVLTQLLQFVYGYSPLDAGIRLLPLAVSYIVMALLSHRLAARIGTKRTGALGLSVFAAALALLAASSPDAGYGIVFGAMVVIGTGWGLVGAPLIESVMGSVPRQKAGIASGMSATTRLAGSAFGVAIFGSLLASGYQSVVTAKAVSIGLSEQHAATASTSFSQALQIARDLDGAGRAALQHAARAGFIHGMNLAMASGAAVLLAGAALALRYLPAHAPDTPEAQEAVAAEIVES